MSIQGPQVWKGPAARGQNGHSAVYTAPKVEGPSSLPAHPGHRVCDPAWMSISKHGGHTQPLWALRAKISSCSFTQLSRDGSCTLAHSHTCVHNHLHT